MTDVHPDPDLIALGIKQPWAELILRGIKTIEVRSQHTNVRGPVYLYTSKRLASIEPATWAIDEHGIDTESLAFGRIVGTVEIVGSEPCVAEDEGESCVPPDLLRNQCGWRLANPMRFAEPLSVRFLPYGVWFYPFKRLGKSRRRTSP